MHETPPPKHLSTIYVVYVDYLISLIQLHGCTVVAVPNKCSAVAEMGIGRPFGHNRHWPKIGGELCPRPPFFAIFGNSSTEFGTLAMGRPFFPQNCPFAWGIWTSVLCQAEAHDRDRQTHRQRDHARYHVCDNRPHYNTV